MQKKKQLKEITLKSKLAKTVPHAEHEELAAQYDNYIAQKAQQPRASGSIESSTLTKPIKPKPRVATLPEPESESEEEEVIVKKPKPKKKAKKIVYESDSEEEVVVRKKKPPLEKLVYDNTKDQLYHRMIEERVRNTILGYGSSLGV
jgi:hypothetical protein